MSVIFGTSEFFSIIISSPLPIDTARKIWGIIPINVAKKKFNILTLKRVGNKQLICHGMPPKKR